MTPNFAEQAEKWLKDNDWDYQKYGDRRDDRSAYDSLMNYEISGHIEDAFLAGCEHGYRVGKQTCDCHSDETGRTAYKCAFHSEIDQLKARLADAETALKEIRGIQEAGIHENGGRVAEKQAIESWIKFGLQELTQHPQDGAKGDL